MSTTTARLSRRAFLRGTLVGGAGLALAACTALQPTAPGSSTGTVVMQAPISIRFMTNAGADALPVYGELLSTDLPTQFPGIEVTVEPTPEGWQEKLVAQMAAGAAPDVFEAWGNIIYQWTGRNLVLDLQPLVDRDMSAEEIADFTAFQWEALEILGIRAGMPRYVNMVTITVNVDKFEEYGVALPPEDGNWTWEDYTEMARQLTSAARKSGNENQWGGYIRPWSFDRFWMWVESFGGKVVNEKYGTQCLLDSDEAQAGLYWQYDMYWTENVFARREQIESSNFMTALTNNLICMAEDNTYPVLLDRRFDGRFRWDMRHIPVGPTGERVALGTSDCWSIWSGTRNADAAFNVVRYMTSSRFQLEGIAKAAGLIPARRSAFTDFVALARSIQPRLEEVRIETIEEAFAWGYPKDTFWFKDQLAAAEIIRPALEAIYQSGTQKPDLFITLAKEITAAQEAA